jgi:hypothetical protein
MSNWTRFDKDRTMCATSQLRKNAWPGLVLWFTEGACCVCIRIMLSAVYQCENDDAHKYVHILV